MGKNYKLKILSVLLSVLLVPLQLGMTPLTSTANPQMDSLGGSDSSGGEVIVPEEPSEIVDSDRNEVVYGLSDEAGTLGLSTFAVQLPPDFAGDPDNIKDILDYMLLHPDQYPDITKNSILDFFDLDFYDSGNNPVSIPSIGDLFNMYIEFTLPPSLVELLTGGEYYEFTMPPEMEITHDQTIPLIDQYGVQYGQIVISTDGTARIEFNSNIDNSTGSITGGGSIYGQLQEGNMTDPGDNVISIPGEEDVPSVPIEVKPNIEEGIDKDGSFDRITNPVSIGWSVEANKSMDSLTNVKITDTLPDGLILPPTIVVEGFEVDFNGNPIPGSEYPLTEGVDYFITGNDASGMPVISFASLDHPVRIKYETEIDRTGIDENGAKIVFDNKVNLTSDEGVDLDANASLTAEYMARLEKNALGYDPSTQTITWEVRYHYDEAPTSGNFTLTDKIPTGMELVWNSFEIRKVTFDADGNAILGDALTEGLDYEVIDNGNGTFSIKNQTSVDFAINIQYKTKVVGDVDEDSDYTNVISDGNGNTGSGTGTAEQQNIIKRMLGYDVANNTVTWQLEVNLQNKNMHDWVLTDTHPDGTLIYDTLTVFDRNTNTNITGDRFPNSSLDYMVREGIPAQGFTLSFHNNYNPTDHKFVITYTTKYDGVNVPEELVNTAHVEWTDDSNNKHTSEDDASVKPPEASRQNGKKGGSYNATTKEITWYLAVNYSNTGLIGAYIDDPIQDPMKYVPNSVKLYHYTETAKGDIIRGTELTSAEYAAFTITDPDDSNGNTLHIDLPDSSADALYYIEYRTSLDGALIGQTKYYNIATFHNDATQDMELNASVSVANGGKYIGKQGVQNNNGQVSWSIVVNESQSTIQNVVVHDVPGANQLIDIDTVVVHQTRVAQNGTVRIDNTKPPLVLDRDYEIDYFQNSDGKWEMDIRFIGAYAEISRPYIIDYNVTVFAGNLPPGSNVELTNNAKISFEHEVEIEQPGDGSVGVDVGGGSGWIEGELGSASFKKVDSVTGNALSNVEFELYYLGATGTSTPLLIGTEVPTGADGVIDFDLLPYGYYELFETEALPGYSLMTPNPYAFQLSSANSGKSVEISNTPSQVSLIKKDRLDDRTIPGTTFALYRKDASDILVGSYITGSDGSLTVYGLGEGNYYFVETQAAPGYVLDTATQYAFSISRDGNGQLITSNLSNTDTGNVVFNDPVSAQITKTNETGLVKLSGAVFIIEQKINGEWTQIRLGEFTLSDANGLLTFDRLDRNAEYRVTEVSAPTGYATYTLPYYFSIDDVGKVTYEGTGELASGVQEFRNYPTLVEIKKTDKDTGVSLAGAVFELYEALYGPSGEIEDWQRIREKETFYTDKEGVLRIGRLASGQDYRLIEVVAPAGYILDPTPIDFVGPYAQYNPVDGTGEILYLPDFENAPTFVHMNKVNEEGKTLAGAVFRLEQNDGGTWSAVAGYESVTTDSNGLLTIRALPAGTYRLIETKAPSGYQLSNTPIEFNVEVNGAANLDLGNFVNSEILIPDTKTPTPSGPSDPEDETKNVIISVKDIPFSATLKKENERGDALQGAEFSLERRDSAGNWVTVISQLSSLENGYVTADNLSTGQYRFVETASPKGYRLDETPVEFTIDSSSPSDVYVGVFVNKRDVGIGSDTSLNVHTGDANYLFLWIVLAGLIGVAITVISVRLTKSGRENRKKH